MSIRPTTKHDIQRDEENITRQGFSVVTQIDVTGSVSMVWSGADRGTGVVLISVSGTSYPLSSLLGGTGKINTGTLTNQSDTTIQGGGVFNLGGYGATIPASGTVAMLEVANVFTANQRIVGASDPFLVISENNSLSSYTYLADLTANQMRFGKFAISGSSIMDFDPVNLDGNGTATIRFFRGSSTSGTVSFSIFKGDGSPTFNTTLSGNGDSYISAIIGNNLGVGVSIPAVKTHIQDVAFSNNAVLEVLRLEAIVSGTNPSTTGFGTGLTFYAETATNGTNQQQAKIETDWTTATNASRKGEMKLYATDTSARLGVTIGTDGAQALLGLYSASPVARGVVTGSRAGNAALASLLTVLNNLGAITNSSSA